MVEGNATSIEGDDEMRDKRCENCEAWCRDPDSVLWSEVRGEEYKHPWWKVILSWFMDPFCGGCGRTGYTAHYSQDTLIADTGTCRIDNDFENHPYWQWCLEWREIPCDA